MPNHSTEHCPNKEKINFVFSKKATKLTIWHSINIVKSTVKISSSFVAFLENMNFTQESDFCPFFEDLNQSKINTEIKLPLPMYTANVCRELQGLYREIVVQGFQICSVCTFKHCMKKYLNSIYQPMRKFDSDAACKKILH